MNIAPATAADLDAIDALERHAFAKPWPRETFEAELAREWARLDVVRDDRGTVVAFCNYWVVPPEMSVMAIATHPDLRSRGIARELLAHVMASAGEAGCTIANLEVRAGNAPAIALYQRAGFQTIHVRARYYQDNDEDALIMQRGLPG